MLAKRSLIVDVYYMPKCIVYNKLYAFGNQDATCEYKHSDCTEENYDA